MTEWEVGEKKFRVTQEWLLTCSWGNLEEVVTKLESEEDLMQESWGMRGSVPGRGTAFRF